LFSDITEKCRAINLISKAITNKIKDLRFLLIEKNMGYKKYFAK